MAKGYGGKGVCCLIGNPGSSGFDEPVKNTLAYLLTHCCTAEEMKKAYKPQMDPR